MSKQEQAKYYMMAKKEKQLHAQQYPNWSAVHNYVRSPTHGQRWPITLGFSWLTSKSVCRVKKGGTTGAKWSPSQRQVRRQTEEVIPLFGSLFRIAATRPAWRAPVKPWTAHSSFWRRLHCRPVSGITVGGFSLCLSLVFPFFVKYRRNFSNACFCKTFLRNGGKRWKMGMTMEGLMATVIILWAR